MTADGEGTTKALDQALADEAATIARRYRVDEQTAAAALRAAIRDPATARAIEAEAARGSGRGVTLRRVAKEARREVYHGLRRYTPDVELQETLRETLEEQIRSSDEGAVRETVRQLLQTHASTRERSASYDAFHRIVTEAVGHPRSIVDLGCGLHPLAQPSDPELAAELYLALDRDERTTRILSTFARGLTRPRLIAERADLEQVDWATIAQRVGVDQFDLAYLLKLVPVVRRQQPAALARIAKVPASALVVTGSKEALTRRQDISRREDQVLLHFIEGLSPATVTRAETEDEIIYVVQR